MGHVKAMLYDWRDDDDGTPETRTPTLAQRDILHAEQDAADNAPDALAMRCPGCGRRLSEWADTAAICRPCGIVYGTDGMAEVLDPDDDLAESLAVERAIDDRTVDVDFGADDFGGFSDL